MQQKGQKKHVTKSATSKPQEEFITQKARPSRAEHATPKAAPPKKAKKR